MIQHFFLAPILARFVLRSAAWSLEGPVKRRKEKTIARSQGAACPGTFSTTVVVSPLQRALRHVDLLASTATHTPTLEYPAL